MSRQGERYSVANLCLNAAEFAVSKGDLTCASRYLEFGLELSIRNDDCWKDEYDLTLTLFSASAEIEYSKSNFDRVDELVSTILQNAACFRDTLRA